MTTVSVIIPCRNEEAHIAACLESLLVQTDVQGPSKLGHYVTADSKPGPYVPHVLVVDGRSDDGTRAIVEEIAARDSRVRLVDNPRKSAAAGMNIGIGLTTSDVIVRADAHAIYPPDYVSRLVTALDAHRVDNAGGVLDTTPPNSSAKSEAIARALSHPFGVGGARFRIGARKEREVDTVPFGCFRRTTLDQVGGYREELAKNEDDELNARIVNNGGKVLLLPDVRVTYFARKTIGELWRQYFDYGRYKPLALRLSGGAVTVRQFVPAASVAALAVFAVWGLITGAVPLLGAAFVGAYLCAAIAIAVREAVARRSVSFGWWLVVSFATLHLAYGLGWWRGVWAGVSVSAPDLKVSSPDLEVGPTYEAELKRIRGVFRQRDRYEEDESKIDPRDPGRRFLVESRERAFRQILREQGLLPLGSRRVLDVGCGVGDAVTRFETLGVPRSSLVGIDLVPERLARARARYTGVTFLEGNAGDLPFTDHAFDVVAQSTMFSSILDEGLRRRAAAEMIRVTKPGGVILWYDFRWNPLNRSTRGLGLSELRRLFPHCEIRARRATLAPPLARPLVAISWRFAEALEWLSPLRSHYCASIKRTPEPRTPELELGPTCRTATRGPASA